MEARTTRKMNINGTMFFCSSTIYKSLLDTATKSNKVTLLGAVDKHSHHYFGIAKVCEVIELVRTHNYNICIPQACLF